MEVDISKDLPKQFQFKVRKEEEVVVEVSYPWLPPRCQTCGKWGHLSEDCVANSKSITILKRGETESSSTTKSITETHNPILSKDKT